MAAKRKAEPLLADLEKALRTVLDTPELGNEERLKAVDSGIRLAMVKHKIAGSGGDDGGFFGK